MQRAVDGREGGKQGHRVSRARLSPYEAPENRGGRSVSPEDVEDDGGEWLTAGELGTLACCGGWRVESHHRHARSNHWAFATAPPQREY